MDGRRTPPEQCLKFQGWRQNRTSPESSARTRHNINRHQSQFGTISSLLQRICPPEVRISGDRLSMVTTAGDAPIFQPPPQQEPPPCPPPVSGTQMRGGQRTSRDQVPSRYPAWSRPPRGRHYYNAQRGRGRRMPTPPTSTEQNYHEQMLQERQYRIQLQNQIRNLQEQLRQTEGPPSQPGHFQHNHIHRSVNADGVYQPQMQVTQVQYPREPYNQRNTGCQLGVASGGQQPPSQPGTRVAISQVHPTIDKFAKLMTNYGKTQLFNPYALAEEDQPDEWYLQQFRHPFDHPPPRNALSYTGRGPWRRWQNLQTTLDQLWNSRLETSSLCSTPPEGVGGRLVESPRFYIATTTL